MKKIFGSMIGLAIIIVLFYFVIGILLSKGCNAVKENGDGSFVKGIGKFSKEIKDDFNEGYSEDTLVVDTLK